MQREKRSAWINWNRTECRWVLRLWIDGEWAFSKSWGTRRDKEDPISGESYEWVHDSIVCEIAHLQDLGYEVKVTC